MEETINEVCTRLKRMAVNQDDIFLMSFMTNGDIYSYRIFNKGDGIDAKEIKDFKDLKNIFFTDTVNQENTNLLAYMKKHNYNSKKGDGELIVAYDGRTKTMNMLGIHNGNLGPPLGGLRQKDYSNYNSMVTDTLRLAKGMTYKGAVADTGTGGGKSTRSVPKGIRKEANLATARIFNFINEKRKLRGLNIYYVAEDSNTVSKDFDDMDSINKHTTCKSLHFGGTGNPSPVTAIGVYYAAKAAAEYAFPDKSLKNKTILLSGVGQVGFELLKNFVSNGAEKVICAEVSTERIEWVKKQFDRMERENKIEFMVYTKEQLNSQKYLHDLADRIDIFAPCALGRSINDTNIDILKGTRLKMICGAENNQLADEEKHGKMLHDMGILYVPDYVANAGGLINCSEEMLGRMFLIADTIKKAMRVENSVREVIELSKKENIPTYLAANKIAEKKFME